ncbi:MULTISPECIES: ABC transporter permease [unclassified Mesorhizobium]|uniref:ABC transporter permease n=1 Tax=unclassified Mesorhizobium TaxID=325217 RepID=UPI000FE45EA2|nr:MULTISPECIES: ABC transporter permease [unclassified Mesorhizobium]RWC68884.1 MAG: ABC transporter permease [Mesorhizobium sp.]TGU87412.1 ABC transporter permease [Mesorhizobium sp. M00.F.Ca.ET.151.01.1.1]TGV51625.1 ABC transporter permease [bacterium M00.F.Ca.ET.141.01.1.1]TGP90053.1 ABC transporter permease [Mesorhizobium sp. M8A.F.Ca.ET.218.01.1.1]TGT16545.1 ABC transporter permease [Mesorhizobium sp. M8A.F.Ca.ET.213.01.1.1]
MAYLTEKLGPAIGFRSAAGEAAVSTNVPAIKTRGVAAGAKVRGKGAHAGTFLYGLPLLGLFFLAWEIAPRLGWLNRIFFPPLSEVLIAWWALLASGVLVEHIGISLQRAAIGFALGVVVAIPLGLLMGRYALFEKVSDLLVQTLRNTSQFALLPVFILLLGIGEESKVAITFYSSVFFLLVNTISGVKSVDPLLIKAARSMGTSDFDLFRKVILPASIPSIVAGARLAVKSSLFAVIGAEMLAAKSGLGFLIQNSQLMMETADMYAGILTLTVIGLTVNYLLVWFERWATAWKGQSESSLI